MDEVAKAVPARRIKSAKITHISLCKRGVNQQPVVMKSALMKSATGQDIGQLQVETLVKGDVEGLLTAVVYVPDRPDNQGDVATREVVKQMAHDFIANGGKIDIEHNLQALGTDKVQVAETFLIAKGDARFADWKDYSGQSVDVTGAWAVILKINDPELQRLYKSGDWNGVSMFGLAELQPLTKSNEGDDVELTQLTAALKESNAAMLEALVKALKPEPVKVETKQENSTDVPFEGDPFNAEDIAKHQEMVLFKSLNLSKPADIAKWQSHLAKREANASPEAKAKADEIAKLKEQLRKMEGASNQPKAGGNGKDEETPVEIGGLSKAESALFDSGRKVGKALFGKKEN